MSGLVRVVVVGGGYAGVMAANRVVSQHSSASHIAVTLIDPGAQFTERIRPHQLGAGGRQNVGIEWKQVLHHQVRHLKAQAVAIDPVRRMVTTAVGSTVAFEYLVYAVGSGATPTRLHSVANVAAAVATRDAIAQLDRGAAMTVAGAGPTGVEVACAVAVTRPDLQVTIVDPSGLAGPQGRRQALTRRLSALGISVEAGTVDSRTGDVKSLDGRIRMGAPVTVWTVGLAVPALAADSGLPVAADGRLLVDETLSAVGHEHIVGAGDAVAVQAPVGEHLRMSCASAIPLGAHAADTVGARLRGAAPPVVDVGYVLQCLDLGEGHGHVHVVSADDTARRWAAAGRAGGWVKEQVCRMTVTWLAKEAREPGSYSWASGPALAR